MPVYTYQAIDQKGRKLSGTMPAINETKLEEKLSTTGVWLLEAQLQRTTSARQEEATTSSPGAIRGRVRRRDLIDFCTLMSFQVKVGVTLVQALDVASLDCDNPAFRHVLAGLQHQIEAGFLFYESLEKYPKVFSPYFTCVIRAGELSSKLPEAFDNLGKYLEWMERIIAEVRQASLYPSVVLTVVCGFVIGLFTFVIPKFAALLASVNVKLPLLTQIIFGISDFMKSTWWLWLLVVPLLVAGVIVGKRYSRPFARFMDKVKMNLPIFGPLNWMLAISRFTHNLSILYRSGIPILQSLRLCQGLTGSILVEDAVATVEEDVKSGSTISEALRRHTIFPPLLLRMVIMGETTGNLDKALDNVADYYNEVIPRRLKKVLTVMEPMLTVFMILLVGCVAISIYLPILALMSSIK